MIGHRAVCLSSKGSEKEHWEQPQAADRRLFALAFQAQARQMALCDHQRTERSSLQTPLVCFATMWRGEACHEVRNPYTLCSMPKNEPQRNAPYGLDKFFSLCYHYGTSLGA